MNYLAIATDGTGTGAEMTDVSAGTKSSTTAALVLSNLSPAANGFAKMTVSGSSHICVAAKDVGSTTRDLIFCAKQSSSSNAKLESYLLVTKPSS